MDVKYANLHLHSTYSDAGFTPHQLVLIGKSLGYKALALTDHETDGGNRPKVFKAPEVKEFNFPQPDAEEVFKAVRKAGGVIALAHPNARFAEHIEKMVDMGLNGIETGHPNIAPEVLPLAIEAAEEYNLYHCGGTDHDGPMSCCGGKYAYPTFDGISEEHYFELKNRTRG